jgi:hypothetical protein
MRERAQTSPMDSSILVLVLGSHKQAEKKPACLVPTRALPFWHIKTGFFAAPVVM